MNQLTEKIAARMQESPPGGDRIAAVLYALGDLVETDPGTWSQGSFFSSIHGNLVDIDGNSAALPGDPRITGGCVIGLCQIALPDSDERSRAYELLERRIHDLLGEPVELAIYNDDVDTNVEKVAQLFRESAELARSQQ